MDIRYIQSFVTTVECGSIAEAARRLDLTSAALAARVRALEEELGTPLLKRSGRSVKPTAVGLNILDSARSMLREERDLRAMAIKGLPVGELRLGTFVSALTTVLPPVLRTLYAQHPDLSVSVVSNASIELCRMVASGELDAAVVVEPQFAIPKTCEWSPLMDEPLVVVAPLDLADRDPHDLLRTQPFIRYDRSVWGGQLADRYLRDHGIRPHQRLEINGLMSIAVMVDHGLGVSLLPDWSALWSGGLSIARVSLPRQAPVRRIGFIWGVQSPHSHLAELFLEHAEEVFRTKSNKRKPRK
ncbi:DNA-binding transcriptional LysR family regulator [Herbaspirillum sp. Sphag1AN]|uniref:LysR substrate-binding domain-containing protein n=1 Tax=unclassified Herbaspirillum TaxID=2624150 RepID=UPI00161B843E|nr:MULTISPECIES: LysR substrate-binding domain-containing protein [unclassified Herbaspirillum]MBB3212742.1 DNA-binding transcriptional LysR family regulator [Herbaspirillum sp. Sphag1AN]MBB3245939.1 DNA-binding transcriptional LysR family regulator [Herbaspirillum sp. Sphag64]